MEWSWPSRRSTSLSSHRKTIVRDNQAPHHRHQHQHQHGIAKDHPGHKRRCFDRKIKSRLIVGGVSCILLVGFPMFLFEMVRSAHMGKLSTSKDFFANVKAIYDMHHPNVRSILNGQYFLIDVEIHPTALAPDRGVGRFTTTTQPGAYGSVTGTFCPIDWRLQKLNPSTVPMFRDLVRQSHHCNTNRVRIDLRKIAEKAREFDLEQQQQDHQQSQKGASRKGSSLKLGGFVFHESRCGSTLVANLLLAASPEKHRVYSESEPPITVLRACEYDDVVGGSRMVNRSSSFYCDAKKQDALLRDVVFLMSRRTPNESHVFFKIQSVGVKAIHVFSRAFPETPWLFVYRDSVETIMSHLKRLSDTKTANCLRTYTKPPKAVKQLVQRRKKGMAKSLTRPQYCAAHLATLCEAAIAEYKENPKSEEYGRFVNYVNLPDVMWESILPNHFNVDIDDAGIENMKKTASVYSKGRGDKANQEWKDDSQHKQNNANDDIRNAVQDFLQEPFDLMEQLSQETTQ